MAIVDIQTPDGVCDAFVARPGDGAAHPGVILYMDAFGLRPYLEEMARKLASFGYYVLVPNLFYRTKPAPVFDLKFPLSREQMGKSIAPIIALIKEQTPESIARDAKAFVDFLARQKEVHPGKIGVTGYCLGGRWAIQTAAACPDRVGAAASFHAGNLATEAADSPHLLANKIQSELYIAHADNDGSMPPEQIERLRASLNQAGVRYKDEIYNGAEHGYTMLDLPAGNPDALNRHWNALRDLFGRIL